MGTTAAEVHVMVLTSASLEHFLEPVGIGVVHKLVLACGWVKRVSTGESCARVGTSLTDIVAVLVSVHHVVNTVRNLVDTEVTRVVHLQRLVFLTVLGGDDDHTIGGTRTVDSTRSSILEHLNGLDIVRREIADGCTHWHTVDYIERSGGAERTDTTDANRWVGARLSVRCDLHARHLTFEHCRDVGVRNFLEFIRIHDRYRTRKVCFLLHTITYYNHLIEHVSVRS